MKSKTPRKKAASTTPSRKSLLSNALRFSRRHSAYAFVAGLGVWLPKAEAATIINLDATAQALGPLATWPNTGTATGDFTSAGTETPVVTEVDGVKGISLISGGANGGAAGSHYVGSVDTFEVPFGSLARTIEAWIFNTNSLAEVNVFAYGRREGIAPDAFNNSFGHGMSPIFGAVGTFLDSDMGWGNSAAQVATNVVIGRWTYIVQTFNGTTNAVYVDGRLANFEGPPNSALIDTAALANDASTPLPFRVARQNTAAGAISGAGDENIVIAKIRMHNSALSAAQIQTQFDAEKGSFNLNDTDTDGMPDWWEVRHGLNKNSAADATGDPDTDGLTSLQEFQRNTNPNDADSDDDGANDGAEVNRLDGGNPAPTNPLDGDSDDDGLLDGVETDTGTYVSPTNTGTDPLKGDSDGDIASDGMEVAAGTDPNSASSTPSLARAIDLDATGLSGLLTNWNNTGFITGNFSVPTNATVPTVITNDGVKGVGLQAPAGATGTHYVGPATTAEVTGASPRTVEAWVFDPADAVQAEKMIIAWGSRNFSGGNTGADYGLGIGDNNDFGAVPAWGAPDLGWNDQEVHGRWTFIATTWDGATNRVYSDGVQVNFEGTTINTPLIAPGDSLPFRFRIGRQNGTTASTDIDNTGEGRVTIAKVRVYTNSLDAATIRARFDSEKTAFGLVDTDGDGLPNWYEIRWGLNPNDTTGNNGASGNPDNDGLTNLQEFQLGTAASLADTDADGANDGAEVTRVDTGLPAPPSGALRPTNPLNPDTDGDGLRDGAETDTGTYANATNAGSDPLVVDTDGDGFSDGVEVSQGSSPVNVIDVPSPNPRISLISTNLPIGLLTNWVNTGTFSNGVAFTSPTAIVPSVQLVQGIPAVRFPGPAAGNPYYNGPTNPSAAGVTGNPVYSIEAWIHNESPSALEEVIMGWGRRNTTGFNSSFSHGTSLQFGAMGHFNDPPDLGYGGVVVYDRWTHVVYTYDPLAIPAVQRAYVDGVQVNQEVVGTPLAIAAVGTANPAPFRVGAQNAESGAVSGVGRASGMSIGELRVYTRVLSASEISTKFNAGRGFYGIDDTDSDGMPDWFERTYGFNQNSNTDASGDADSDGLTNLAEYQNKTNPLDSDSDDDGVLDGEEVTPTLRPFPTSPNDADTDRDGLNDNVETGTGTYVSPSNTGTVANFRDSDGDTYPDATEVAYRIVDGVTDPTANGGASIPNTSSPVPVIKLDATGLSVGPLLNWTNLSGLPNWDFVAPTGAIASVAVVDGTRGVVLNTTNYYTGHGAPVDIAGNASRTVDAWIHNPARVGEETVFSWGRRGGGPDGSNSSFVHGTDPAFGAMGLWGGGPDLPWGTNATLIANNVKTSVWTHVAYTYDNATGIRACYVDGLYANSETNAVGVVLATHSTNAVGGSLFFRVGAQNEADGSRSGAAVPSMTVAKLRVYDLALSAAQIGATYNAERVQFPGQPKITNVKVNPVNGFVSFDWVPAPGRTYAVERNTDVAAHPSGWTQIATGQTSGSYTNDPAGAQKTFYRLRLE